MAVVIAGVHIEAMGTTREETLDALDTLAGEVKDLIGGMPWLTAIDAVSKIEAPGSVKDDQGNCYTGTRRIVFVGPMVREYQGMPFHEGNNVQRFAKEGDE